MLDFKDNFSIQADIYSRYRPVYPDEMFAYLSARAPGHQLAWDCGTGNGQAALSLVNYFEHIVATDPSEAQLVHATQHPRIQYITEVAEHSSLNDGSVDIVTVANAMHWFDLEKFYAEVRRVLRPGGVLAAWCYQVPSIDHETDKILMHYHEVVLNGFWKEANRLVDLEYTTIPFPFMDVQDKVFYAERMFDLDDVISYLNTWSATQRYIREKGVNPTEGLKTALQEVWGDPHATKNVTWKLILKAGRVADVPGTA